MSALCADNESMASLTTNGMPRSDVEAGVAKIVGSSLAPNDRKTISQLISIVDGASPNTDPDSSDYTGNNIITETELYAAFYQDVVDAPRPCDEDRERYQGQSCSKFSTFESVLSQAHFELPSSSEKSKYWIEKNRAYQLWGALAQSLKEFFSISDDVIIGDLLCEAVRNTTPHPAPKTPPPLPASEPSSTAADQISDTAIYQDPEFVPDEFIEALENFSESQHDFSAATITLRFQRNRVITQHCQYTENYLGTDNQEAFLHFLDYDSNLYDERFDTAADLFDETREALNACEDILDETRDQLDPEILAAVETELDWQFRLYQNNLESFRQEENFYSNFPGTSDHVSCEGLIVSHGDESTLTAVEESLNPTPPPVDLDCDRWGDICFF